MPEAGYHFAVFLIDGETEYLLGSLTEPNRGAVYQLNVAGEDIPVTGDDLQWQVRLQSLDGSDVLVSSDPVPLIIHAGEPTATVPGATATVAPTDTVGASPTACTPDPPPGWVLYTIRPGDALAGLADRGNVPVETVMQVNCLPNDLLSVGQQIYLPAGAIPRTPTPAATFTSPPPARPTVGNTPELPQPTATNRPPGPTDEPPTPTEPPPTDAPTIELPTQTPDDPPTLTPPPA